MPQVENKVHAFKSTIIIKRRPGWKSRFAPDIFPLLPGLLLSGLIAALSITLDRTSWFQAHGLSALTIAILLGIGLGNTVFPRVATACGPGVMLSKQNLLRLGIILYGFRLTFQDVAQVGIAGVAIDALVVTSTFFLALLLGTRLFKLDRNTVILIGAGSSICGAAAVMATESVVRGKAEQVAVAVATVVVFGTLTIALYPLLYRLNLHWHFLGTSSSEFGIYAGSTIHEVAQVVAAARSVSQEAANAALIAKMARVMMLAPFLLLLSAFVVGSGKHAPASRQRATVPWFAWIFIGTIGLNSLALLPRSVTAAAIELATFLLAMAMAALGLTTQASVIRRAGYKPLMLAMLLFLWLIAGGAAINRGVMLLQ